MVLFSFWVLGVALIIAQTTLLQFFPDWIGEPDFLFVLVGFAGYRFAWIPGIVLVFILGWMIDVVVGIHLGLYPLMCLLTFTGLKLLTINSPVKESTYQIPFLGVSYFLMQMFGYFVYSLTVPELLPEWSWVQTTQRTLVVVLSAIPFFLLFNGLFEYLQKRRLRSKPLRRRPRKSL